MGAQDPSEVEGAIRRREQHLAAAQRIARCGSWELDLAGLEDGTRNPPRWSDEVFRILGYEPGAIAVTHETFFNAIHPEDRAGIEAAVAAAVAHGTPYAIDHRVIRPDGSVRMVHGRSEVELEAGRPVRMVATVHDLTEQRMTEAQLVFAERMATVGALVSGVAHEINNPLAAVLANLDLLELALRDATARSVDPAECVRDAREGARRVRAIVRDLVVYARPDDARRRLVIVPEILDSALRLIGHEIRHRARLVRAYGEVPAVRANESRLGQVFVNLLSNAAHAIPEGAQDEHEIRVACASDPRGHAVITISDTGHGIAPELRTRVFAPFFTTKPAGIGAGLGLSICRRIITELGGEIDFDSTPGGGTTFRIRLPAADPKGPADVPATARRRHRLLLIDDEAIITTALQRMFGDHELTVFNAARPALEAIAAGSRFDAILCDLMMPVMTGMELHGALVRLVPDQAARMIVMTGGAFSEQARAFLAESGVPRIDKPFDLDEIRRLVDRIATRA